MEWKILTSYGKSIHIDGQRTESVGVWNKTRFILATDI